jgi:VTC domain
MSARAFSQASEGAVAAESRVLQEADERMTAERDEVKYLVPAAEVKALAMALGRHLPHHRFTGKGANPLPRPRHFVTTVYFDTPSRHQFRAIAADSEHNLKMRAKEYYDLHPSLAELATDPRQIVKYQPVLWLELKFRDGTKSGKRRIGIPKPEVPAFFKDGAITAEMVELQRATYGTDSEAVLREIAGYCGRYQQPMQADCLVNYRRIPWQDEAGNLRVTLDLGLEFYAPPADLWQRRSALVRESLGQPVGTCSDAVLELKSRGDFPAWLDDLLITVSARRVRFSKFESAAAAVHGS